MFLIKALEPFNTFCKIPKQMKPFGTDIDVNNVLHSFSIITSVHDTMGLDGELHSHRNIQIRNCFNFFECKKKKKLKIKKQNNNNNLFQNIFHYLKINDSFHRVVLPKVRMHGGHHPCLWTFIQPQSACNSSCLV